ncbi:MAG TPA: MurR/RpiR family transcriptional regulator, partial [Candidatus Intestinimonas pullistercoris]|nr:MurR/RpiR family transcriptional regulator [Candidatus Intestinimonas pullistercoris]
MSRDILSIIQERMPTLSKGQRRVAQFILDAYDKAAFMTASRLGETVQVSESTVVRFAAELGCGGYPNMQRALQEMVRSKLTSIQRIEVANDRLSGQDVLSTVMQADMELIRATLTEVDRERFSRAVDAILAARHIYILGLRSSAALADFLGFYFQMIFDNVQVVH